MHVDDICEGMPATITANMRSWRAAPDEGDGATYKPRVQRPATIVEVRRRVDWDNVIDNDGSVRARRDDEPESMIVEGLLYTNPALRFPSMVSAVVVRDEVSGALAEFTSREHTDAWRRRRYDLTRDAFGPLRPPGVQGIIRGVEQRETALLVELDWLDQGRFKKTPPRLMREQLRVFVGRRLPERQVRRWDPGVRFGD